MNAPTWRARPILWGALALYCALVVAGAVTVGSAVVDDARGVAILVPLLYLPFLALAMASSRDGWSWARRLGFSALSLAGGATMTLVLGFVILPVLGMNALASVTIAGLVGSVPWLFLALWESRMFVDRLEGPRAA